MIKKQRGQFFTAEADYIFQGFAKYVKGKSITDPFAGKGDLLNWAEKNGAEKVIGYDVDPRYIDQKKSFLNDSLLNPQKYSCVVTNPPYLNVNKADRQTKNLYFQGSRYEDLYQLSLATLVQSKEGIVIVPINFLSAENSKRIRELFFSKFEIIELNYFTKRVFPDTTYNVIAFYYREKEDSLSNSMVIKAKILPEGRFLDIDLNRRFHWKIGGEILARIEEQKNLLGVRRLTECDMEKGDRLVKVAYNHIDEICEYRVSEHFYAVIKANILFLRAIDSGTLKGKIRLENIRNYGLDCLVSKESSRHMINLLFSKKISFKEQRMLMDLFNEEINRLRDNYFSLFLTNFRDNDRKRISFDFVYKFINYLYFTRMKPESGQGRLLPLKNYEQVS